MLISGDIMSFGLILDLIVVIIVLVCAFLSAKHGFVRTVLELAGFIAAIFIAFTISSPLATITYDKMIEPSIVSKIEQTSDEGSSMISEKLWNSFPEVVKRQSANIGISQEGFNEKVSSSISSNVAESAEKISENVTKPIITKVLSAVYSTVIAIVLIILSKFLAKVINKLFKISFIGKINSFLGGVLGALKGIAIAVVFCMAVSLIVSATKSGVWIFNSDNIEASHLFKIFYGFSPFV